MSEQQEPREPRDKADLLARIDASWSALQRFIDRTDPARLTGPRDDEGWTVADHLTHLAAWERSMVFLLQGRPRHEGLGVAEALYLAGDEDAINAAIQQRTADRPLEAVLADLRGTHEQLLDQIAALSDEDLRRPYAHFLPDEPGEESGAPILDRLIGNTYAHYDTHRGWMETLAGKGHSRCQGRSQPSRSGCGW